MKTVIKIAFMLVLIQFTLLSTWASAEETHKRESCRVCGMWIDQYQKSAAELVYKDGKKEYACGVACMLRIVEDEGGIAGFESVKGHDWGAGKLVDAQTATYVLGSKVIPDMVPNYIAFAKRDEAEAFAAKEGGDIIDFNIAYDDVSPVGTTAPFRIRTAVTPGVGNFSAGMVYGYTQKDNLKIGSNGEDPDNFIHSNIAQPKAPKESQAQQQSLTLNYSPTDNLALFMNVPWFEKRLTTLSQTQPTGVLPGKFGETTDNTNGLGDISIEGRYNLWRSTRWDKFASVLLGTSLPTGHFNGNRDSTGALQAAGLQLGKGTLRPSRAGCFILSVGKISGYTPQPSITSILKMMTTLPTVTLLQRVWPCTTRQTTTGCLVSKWMPATLRKMQTEASRPVIAAARSPIWRSFPITGS